MTREDFARIYLNGWRGRVASERRLFSDRLVAAITDSTLRSIDVRPREASELAVCVDASWKWDTSVVAVWYLENDVPTLGWMEATAPTKAEEVSLSDLKVRAESLYKRFAADAIIVDPREFQFAIQEWKAKGPNVVEWSGHQRVPATAVLRGAVHERKVRIPPAAGACEIRGKVWCLQSELKWLVARQTNIGLVYDHEGEGTAAQRGYDDRVTTMAMALWYWAEIRGKQFRETESTIDPQEWREPVRITRRHAVADSCVPAGLDLVRPGRGSYFGGRSHPVFGPAGPLRAMISEETLAKYGIKFDG